MGRDPCGQVVVVLDGLQGSLFAEEAEVVDGHWFGEEGLERCWGRQEEEVWEMRQAYLRPFPGRYGGWGQ